MPRAHGVSRPGSHKAAPTSPVPGGRARKESWKRAAIHSAPSIHRLACYISLQRLPRAALKTSSRRRRIWLSISLSAGRHAEPPSLVEGQSPHPSHHTLTHSRRKNQQTHTLPRAGARDNHPPLAQPGRCYETLSPATRRRGQPARLDSRPAPCGTVRPAAGLG